MFFSNFFVLLPFLVFIVVQLMVPVIFWIVIIRIIVEVRRSRFRTDLKNTIIYSNPKEKYSDVSKDKLSELNISDINILKDQLFDIFYNFEKAYNNLDYNTMRSLCTKKIYQNYHTGISLDLKLGNKKVIDNIKRENVIVYEIYSSSQKQVVSTIMDVSYVNYTLDKKGTIISGNISEKVKEKFEILFIKEFLDSDSTNCPNCGALLNNGNCSYCQTVIKDDNFKISSIKKIQ